MACDANWAATRWASISPKSVSPHRPARNAHAFPELPLVSSALRTGRSACWECSRNPTCETIRAISVSRRFAAARKCSARSWRKGQVGGSPTHVAQVDFARAYDSIHRQTILQAVTRLGFHRPLPSTACVGPDEFTPCLLGDTVSSSSEKEWASPRLPRCAALLHMGGA